MNFLDELFMCNEKVFGISWLTSRALEEKARRSPATEGGRMWRENE
jgi:hypothetical protein